MYSRLGDTVHVYQLGPQFRGARTNFQATNRELPTNISIGNLTLLRNLVLFLNAQELPESRGVWLRIVTSSKPSIW